MSRTPRANLGTILDRMAFEKSGNPMNAALAAELTDWKKDKRLTFEALNELTGISVRTLKRIFNDERVMDTDQIIEVSRALGVLPSQVVANALARLEKHDGI